MTALSESAAARRSTRRSCARCSRLTAVGSTTTSTSRSVRGSRYRALVLPLVALPTTSGTGSEVTTVAIVDVGVKSGISHRFLRPRIAIVDPLLTTSCPPGVTASVGLDALLHAVEAYTTLPYDRERVARSPAERPPYQGAHPMSDLLCEQGDRDDRCQPSPSGRGRLRVDARGQMALAATIAGVGFGSAGVHIPHALSYPIASLKHAWTPPDYGGAAFVPHGLAVAVTAPASFRFIADAAPDRCRNAARLLDGGDDLAESIERLMRDVGSPMTISELGYGKEDIPEIVEGALNAAAVACQLAETHRRSGARDDPPRISLVSVSLSSTRWDRPPLPRDDYICRCRSRWPVTYASTAEVRSWRRWLSNEAVGGPAVGSAKGNARL